MKPRAIALLVALVVLGTVWPTRRIQPLSAYDQPFYIGIADDLVRDGTFTDGFMFARAGLDGRRPPGMRFAPLYPALLAGVAAIDPALAGAFDRVPRHDASRADARAAWPLRLLQFVLLAVSYALVFDIALLLAGRTRLAWIALGLALLTGPLLLYSVDYLMTEITSLFFSTVMTAGLVRVVRGKHRWALPTGLSLGLAILVRPAFLYLGYAIVLAGLVLSRRHRTLIPTVLLASGALLIVLPWIARNEIVLDRPQLTFGYAGHTLAQRISFDSMNWREYELSFVCWLPDGNGLGRALAGQHACDRFGWDERPDTFYAIGMRELVPRTLAAAGGAANHLHWLIVHEIARDPVWHAAVTIPLALRGLWVDHYWGLILAPLCLWLMLRRRDPAFLAVSLPAFFMLVFNAAFAVNQVRYNFMLIVPLAIAGAIFIERIGRAAHLIGDAGAGDRDV